MKLQFLASLGLGILCAAWSEPALGETCVDKPVPHSINVEEVEKDLDPPAALDEVHVKISRGRGGKPREKAGPFQSDWDNCLGSVRP